MLRTIATKEEIPRGESGPADLLFGTEDDDDTTVSSHFIGEPEEGDIEGWEFGNAAEHTPVGGSSSSSSSSSAAAPEAKTQARPTHDWLEFKPRRG